MIFSSNIFLFLFLPITLLGYFLIKDKYKNIFLLLMSLIFYAWGEPKFVFVMIASIIFNYLSAVFIDKFKTKKKIKRSVFILSIMGNLSLLFAYKYLDFAIANVNRFGFTIPLQKLVLPIGISFFTFQAMSYVIDVYRGDVEVQKKLHKVGLFIALFPQLIAGPIVRYKDIAKEIDERTINFALFSEGVQRFVIGLSKKVLIANNMAIITDKAFAIPSGEISALFAWLGIIAYALQIYFDFSGYSDMAIGLGKMFGFNFLENFNYPYMAHSISEFWRRWHMSLGQWFRDYVYFPLGGSKVKKTSRLIFNLFIVWTLTGVWHGANWNFIFWGLLYFVLITFEKVTGIPKKFKSKTLKIIYRIITLLLVLIGWVFFRANNMTDAIKYLLSMLSLRGNPLIASDSIFYLKEYLVLLILGLIFSTNIPKSIWEKLKSNKNKKIRINIIGVVETIVLLFVFLWIVSYTVLGSYNPFIYFNF